MSSFKEFCGGPIWNHTEFLASSWPQFTPCFIESLLVWVPCGYFALVATIIVALLYADDTETHPLPLSALNASKLFCQCAAALLSFVNLLVKASQENSGEPVAPVAYLADAIKVITFIATAVVGQIERRKGVHASVLQLTFWIFFVISHIIPAYTLPILKVYDTNFVGFVIFFIVYALALVLVVLNCFSESQHRKPGKDGYQAIDKEPCPVSYASALSKIFFIWMFKLVRTGFKRDIEESDMWLLPHNMSCNSKMPKFERLWREEEERCKKQKKHQELTVSYKGPGSSKGAKASEIVYLNEKTRLSEISEGPRSVYTHYLDRTTDTEDSVLPQPSLMRVLWKQFHLDFFSFTSCKMLSDLAVCAGPVFLNLLINYMENRTDTNQWQGIGICVLMLVVGQFRIGVFNYSMITAFSLGIVIKSVLIAAIYKKAMRINNASKKKSTVGEIVNLMSVDAQRVQEFVIKVSFSITTPVQIVVAIAIIYTNIGPSVLVGFLVLMLLIPTNVWIATRQKNLLRKNLTHKDTRLRMVNEILNGIKVLKLYAWETSFHDRVQAVRAREIAVLLKIALFYVISGVCWNLAGFLVTLATFATFTLSDRNNFLDPGAAFLTLSFFNILKSPMDFLSSIISLAAQAYVSIGRINEFLLYDELPKDNVIVMQDAEHVVTIEGADFTWDQSQPPTLKNINLHIPPGQLVAVVGPVGAGKSSLISAILGEMETKKGTLTRRGKMAYVAQQAWIQNATVRDNITFSRAYREKKYKAVVSACELERDFTILSAGDMTEIGEKGINLSGGQRQRVSMARAVYQDSDLYLLDDPLSAVDSHVGKSIFDNVFGPKGLLKNKTRVLVTHGVHFLPKVDWIVVMHEGQIKESGTYEELLAHDGPFAQFLKEHLTQEQLEGFDEDEDPEVAAIKDNIWGRIEMLTSDAATSGDEARALRRRRRDKLDGSLTVSRRQKDLDEIKNNNQHGKLVTTEVLAKGRVSGTVYLKYLKAAGPLPLFIGISMFWVFQAVNVITNFWLTDWTQDPFLANISNTEDSRGETNDYYLLIYGLFGILQAVLLIGYYYLFWTRMVMAGRNLHSEVTTRLFKAPMAFFDTTPIGRILNRCSRDIEIVDNFLPIICRDLIGTFAVNFVTIIVIMIVTPIFGAVLIPVILFFYFTLRFYVPTSRQLRRIEHITRSPIYTHFSESISGSPTIHAYAATGRFIDENKRRIDYNNVYFYGASCALRWLSVSLDTLANFVIFASGFFQVLTPGTDAGTAGLTVSYALQITGSLPWMVRQIADFETNIVSVERLNEYSQVDQESDWIVSTKRPLPNWPSQGAVDFNNFKVRYRAGLDLVIRGITVKIQPGEKVGIVGRTGAGKSSLSLSLFRLMEAAEGSIIVDGVNIADIGLHDLRSRLTILPQEPVMFSGSLRMNLDPFEEFSDDAIWTALERAHLKTFASQLPDKLMYECGEEGQNISVGQRQLVCLARSLLRKTKILILDEATAAVDMQTDALIQNTIRLAFQDCTILAIAHRLNTILDYDKVLVLDAGLIKEYAAPSVLLEDKSSVFYSMAADANLV